MRKLLKNNWQIILLFFLSLTVSWPLFKSGYFSHQDDLQVIRIFEMRKCLTDFQIPCRWVPDMGWGNGFPLFNFYGVFSYYLGAIISFLTGYILSAKILFFLALSAGSFGMYFLIKDLWGKYAGFTSAVLYLYAPYKALDVYVRGALAESIALSLIPFVFYFYLKFIKNNSKRYFILSTLFLSFFLTTHNIMTLVFFPILLLWIMYRYLITGWKGIKYSVLSILFAFGMSSFFLLPAFFEKHLVQTESLTRFELDYRANFINVKQLFLDRSWGYGTSIPGPQGGMSFQIGWPYWVLAIISLFALFVKKTKTKNKILILGFFAVFLISIFMTHNKSTFIWERIPLLVYFQFPWRFLSLSIFTSSILSGTVIWMLKSKYQKYLFIAVAISTIILNWEYFKPREFYKVNDEQKLTGDLWETQRRGAVLDYLPKTALEPREAAPTDPLVISGEATVTNFENRSASFNFLIEAISPSVIEIPIYYFPNWEIYVDDQKYPERHNNLVGRMRIEINVGKHKIDGVFKNTPIRTVSNIITLLSLAGFLSIIKWKKLQK